MKCLHTGLREVLIFGIQSEGDSIIGSYLFSIAGNKKLCQIYSCGELSFGVTCL